MFPEARSDRHSTRRARCSERAGDPDLPQVAAPRPGVSAWTGFRAVAALVGSLGVIGGVLAGVAGGCTSNDCEGGCEGGEVYPAWREDDPVREIETVEWKFEFEGDHYEITCTTGPAPPAAVPIGHGNRIVCEGTWVHITRDVGRMRIQARDAEGRWSTDGWYEVVPGNVGECDCSLFHIIVPIAYRREDA